MRTFWRKYSVAIFILFCNSLSAYAENSCNFFLKANKVSVIDDNSVSFSFNPIAASEILTQKWMLEDARQSILDYFLDLGVDQIYLGYSDNEYANELLFVSLTRSILEHPRCRHLFCIDPDLKGQLLNEIDNGRIVLLTHAFQGFVGAAFNETLTRNFFGRKIFDGKDAEKSVLVVTPKTIMSTVIHELQHAADQETNSLKSFTTLIDQLLKLGELDTKSAFWIHSFVSELRAYSVEYKWIKKSTRIKEFLVDTTDIGYNTVVEVVDGNEFKKTRLEEITMKLHYYFRHFKEALAYNELSEKNRNQIINLLREFEIKGGPQALEEILDKLDL